MSAQKSRAKGGEELDISHLIHLFHKSGDGSWIRAGAWLDPTMNVLGGDVELIFPAQRTAFEVVKTQNTHE